MYKVESYSGWFVTDTKTKREAYKEGAKEFGGGYIKEVSKATKEDVDYFIVLKGEDATRAS